jgi:N-acyl-D-aspartate/D-glutamate deacylase
VAPDLVIRGGTVFDGSGAPGRRADVAVGDGRVLAVGPVGRSDCRELDASGLFVCPGFIDIHSHSDFTLLVDPRAVSALHQGVTLEVVGNCGHGCFPIADPGLASTAIYGFSDDLALTWRTAGEYFERLEAAQPAVNVISLIPNGQLRLASVGLAERAATPDELETMTRLLDESLAAGAWGLSTGLEYPQESGASEDEVAALCEHVAAAGGLYATHTRRRDEGAAEAIAEALRVCERTGVRLQVSHLLPRNGAEESATCIALVEEGRARGLDVAFDMHTRPFGLTHLFAALPPSALADGRDGLVTALTSPRGREETRRYRSIVTSGGDFSRVVLFDNEIWPQYARRSIADIACERGQDPLDTVCDLLLGAVDDPHALMVLIWCYEESQQREVFAHPLCMPASDATTLAPDGPLACSTFHGAYTWAAWFYRWAVNEQRLLSPAEAIHRLTALPASRLRLADRGTLRPGSVADVVAFDPERYGERGSVFAPNQLARGVAHVLVNGVPALVDGDPTGRRAGTVLRREPRGSAHERTPQELGKRRSQ